MRSRAFIGVVAALVLLFGGAAALLAYDGSQAHTIARGITIGGVDVGGLDPAQARSKLRDAYSARLSRPVVVRFHRRSFVLDARAARVAVDIEGSVQQALARSRSDNLFARAWRSLTGGTIHAQFQPQLTFSRSAIAHFTLSVARALDRPARDAGVAYSGLSIGHTQSQTGIAVQRQELAARIASALGAGAAGDPVSVPVATTRPHVSTAMLAARYPTIITVDRSTFTLRLWKRLRLVRSYRIAVGMAGLDTPAGLYHIQDKEVNPAWHVPNSAWAGALAGKTIPPGPADPIKARWMGIFNGAGIHGTDELSSLGSAASHGCIRMAIPDVIQLYGETPLGTPVYIA